ncbi:hypothetical protein B7463_g7964, partial [Scytalidium lignicola]
MPPPTAIRTRPLLNLLRRSSCAIEVPSLSRSCLVVQTRLRISTPPRLTCHGCRNFGSTPVVFKKGGKGKGQQSETNDQPEQKQTDDPYDFSTLDLGITKVLEKLKNDLAKLRTGGRFNPEALENVRVHLTKDSKSTIKLGELAQVLPKGGRMVTVLHVKPIVSAIQGTKDLNLQPVVDAHNASQLNIPIPPPTKESRDLAMAAAHKAGETAHANVRNERAVMQKRLRAMELKKTVRPDDLRKAHKEMEKIVDAAGTNIKKTVDAARKAMEQA